MNTPQIRTFTTIGILFLFFGSTVGPLVSATATNTDTNNFCQYACPHHQSNRLVACSANFVSLGGHA
jgi:hypothetical protein